MWKKSESKVLCLLTFIVLQTFNSAHSFLAPVADRNRLTNIILPKDYQNHHQKAIHEKSPAALKVPRGGSELKSMAPFTTDALYPVLQSGPYGLLGLTAVAAVAVVPLTLYKQMYAISVGYGSAIFLIGLMTHLAFQPTLLGQTIVGALMFYGFRLASYLLLREKTRKFPPPQGMKETSLIKKLPLALSVSLFYGFLTTPVLYTLRNMNTLKASPTKLQITQGGIGLAIFGALLEALADLQKYFVKQSSKDDKTFEGPTNWAYRICRHPNYLGEVLFWGGIFVTGAPSFGKQILPWISSVLGLYGIISIMSKATERLEGRQQEKYGDQTKYKEWTAKVKSPLFPFFS